MKTSWELFTHLETAYGGVKPEHMQENERRMREEWNPPQMPEVLLNRLETGKKFAAETDPISETML